MRILRSIALLAALACVALPFGGGSASADVNDVSGAGAFGVSVNANAPVVGTVTVGPTPSVDLPAGGGADSDTLASVNGPPVLTTSVLNVSTQGGNLGSHDGFSTSAAAVNNTNLLSGALTADVITASCTSNGDGSTGASSLLNASAGSNPLDVSPPPNTTVRPAALVITAIAA